MNIETLMQKIKEEFDQVNLEHLNPDTVFLEIEGWNSLYSLMLMAMVSTEFNVELSGQQLRNIRTVQDLYTELTSSSQS